MKNFKISIANTYLDVTYNKDDSIDNSPNSLKYFIKGSIEYQNPKFFNLSLNCIANPGSYYTPITSAYYIDALKVYKPVYSNKKYSAYYNGYKTFNCTINKNFVLLKKFPTILYFTVTNIFNSNNEKTVYYNTDYTQSFFDDYQKRMYYFGLIINFYY